MLDQIGEPVLDRLFFAGEATNSIDYASAHAAYMSGLRVADQINTAANNLN
ncbi:MAG: FAD-dependent oxidoreductase [Candidatus Obscuribacterales bacterium]|nr:FAD-dependent oxidoreductase [Candidatus Obscuribacterales bacterium]